MPILEAVATLLRDPTYADLELRCQGKTFKVHRAIVCRQEAQTGIIELNDDAPEILDLLITYLYTEDYTIPINARAASRHSLRNSNLLIHAEVHTIADKYGVTELVNLAVTKFKTSLEEEYLSISRLAQFTEVLRFIFKPNQNNETLRQLCLQFAAKNYKELVKHEEFQEFCQDDGGVAYEILKTLAGGKGENRACLLP